MNHPGQFQTAFDRVVTPNPQEPVGGCDRRLAGNAPGLLK
jgi:hypothetical protein